MSLPKPPSRSKHNSTRSLHHIDGNSFQTTSMAQLHGSVPGRMVVLGPERTFKLRDPLDPQGLLQHTDSGNHGISSPLFATNANDRTSTTITRSYSLSSYDDILREAKNRRCPRNYCFAFLGALFCLGIGAAFGIYFGFQTGKPEKHLDNTYRGTFRIIEGDWYEPILADLKSPAFTDKARGYELQLDALFKNSSIKDIFLYSEILAFEGNVDDPGLSVFFNLYCWSKKSLNDSQEMENILRDEFRSSREIGKGSQHTKKHSKYIPAIIVDLSSIEVKARTMEDKSDYPSLRSKNTVGESFERRLDKEIVGQDESTTHFNKEVYDRNKNRNGHSHSPSRMIPAEPSDPACVPISMKFCRHLQYNFTSYPNLLGHRGPRDADRLNEAAKLLVESECSPYIQHVLCHVLQPPCSESVQSDGNPSMVLPPCRNVCMAVSTACKAKIGLSQQNRRQDFVNNKLLNNDIVTGLRDLLRCDLFPIDNGMDSCTSKPVTNHIPDAEPSECVRTLESNGHGNRICDGLMDCHDFSDEVACDYCPEGLVHCGVGAACIDVKQRCDGVPDCPNGSDERGCLTVAPDMDAAHFVHQYFQEGYVVFSEGNSTGKICVDSLNTSSLSPARQQSFLEMFGESACRSMSYRTMEHVSVRVDNERSVEYAHLTEPARWRATFIRAPCRSRRVLHLTCSELECGIRPVHVHPDRPGNHLTILPASHGDWPWLAALIRDGVHACDGTLIADQWLLTSSYCFEGQGRAHWVARFATVRLSSDAPWEQERRIVGMVRSPVKNSNLALIKLESPVIFSDFVRPICLTKESATWKAMTSRCLFLAWGKGDVLHEVTAKIQNNPLCNNTSNVCAELLSSKDYCQNDEFAGSPLLCQEKAGEAWSLVGVSSENRHCDTPPTHQESRIYDGIINNANWIVHTVRR